VTVAAGVVLVLGGAEASLGDVLAAALEANREMARLAAELREENSWLREENARLREENAGQAAELVNLRADLAVLQRMVFGRSSERSRPEPAAGEDGAGRSGERDSADGSGKKRGPGARAGRRD
jgi:transposase